VTSARLRIECHGPIVILCYSILIRSLHEFNLDQLNRGLIAVGETRPWWF